MTDDKDPVIRAYRPEDRAAVRRICCDTAYRNKGAEYYFEDREIHADYWTSYYTDYIPDEVRIVERDGAVIGYFFGCPDSKSHRRTMARRIVPWAIARALWRLATGRYKSPMSRRYLWFMITKAPAEEPPIDIEAYPAHYHCNITEAGRGQHLYTTLSLDFVDRLEACGITHMHGHMTEKAKSGVWDIFIKQFTADGSRPEIFRSERPTRINAYLRGDPTPMVNRAWGCDLETFRGYLVFLRDRMRL